jgi:hypothetical protein
MKLRKAISEESLRRLWSEISLLRHEVEQAERDRIASQVQLHRSLELLPTGAGWSTYCLGHG